MDNQIIKLYTQGHSAQEIKDQLNLPVTVRTLQRRLVKAGVIRTVGDAFRLAVKKGKVTHPLKGTKIKRLRLHPGLRYQILERDNFRCVLCGDSAKEYNLEVDHINEDVRDNNPLNLRTLCEVCNRGRGYAKSKNYL